MSFTKQPYAGDSNGENVLLVMKKTPVGANFIRAVKSNMSTQDYVTAGGDTFATAAELVPFKIICCVCPKGCCFFDCKNNNLGFIYK